jgi:hypothetical protein
MPGKRFTTEKIINMSRETEVLFNTEKSTGEVCRELNISDQTYYGCGRMDISNPQWEVPGGRCEMSVEAGVARHVTRNAEMLVEPRRREYNHIGPHRRITLVVAQGIRAGQLFEYD